MADQVAPVYIESSDPRAKATVTLHTLCDTCRLISEELAGGAGDATGGSRWTRHLHHDELQHSSLADLQQSAAACHLCSIMLSKWTHRKPPSAKSFEFKDWDPARPLMEKFVLRLYDGMLKSRPSMQHMSIDGYGIKKFSAQITFHWYAPDKEKSIEYKSLRESSDEADLTTAGDKTFVLASFWLQNCLQKHVKCRKGQESIGRSSSPARLLFLGTPGMVRVVAVPQRATRNRPTPSYITLSHCWGGASVLKLTSATKQELARGVPVDRLPKTFRDAVESTLRLGHQYIWIDSLCIVQDSAEDWAQQSAIMGQIYRNSVCTIAATASSNSLEGCFVQCKPLSHHDCRMTEKDGWVACARADKEEAEPDFRPLDTRGWVFQEDLLSPRTLSFCHSGIEWSCLERKSKDHASWERLADRDRMEEQHHFGMDTAKADFNDLCLDYSNILSIEAKHYPSFHARWWELLRRYSRLNLTFGSDKLAAVHGVIETLASYTGLKSVGGHWMQMLPHDLLWIAGFSQYDRHSCVRPANYWKRAPSWSWASIDGPVLFIFLPSSTHQHGRDAERYSTDRSIVAEVIDVTAPPAIQPRGSVAMPGRIVMSAPLFRCRWWTNRPRRPFYPGGGRTWWYADDSLVKLWGRDLWLAMILRTKRTNDHPCDSPWGEGTMDRVERGVKLVIDEGLVLARKGEQFEFERVGVFSQEYWKDESRKDFVFFRQDGSQRTEIIIF
ncbi:hypothetical protein PspLS_01820 [Pyricularia sp. CBS 133598]|nr:hypothetical protein PspLS_01820 [Pyricularia sp. CBS 133598]